MPDRWFFFDRKGDVLEIFISGKIDDEHSGGFLDALRDHIPVEQIVLCINSEGGDVYTGVAIYNRLSYLSREGVKVRAFIEGIASSSAAIVAMAADQIEIAEDCFMQLHAPQGDDERLVSLFTDTFVRAISNRTGRSRDEVATLLENGHWMDGRTAVWEKLADTIVEPVLMEGENV